MIFGLKRIAQDGVSLASVLIIVGGPGGRRRVRAPPAPPARPASGPAPVPRRAAFTAALATYGLSILFLFGGFLFLPQYLQLVLGLSPFRAGLWTLPWALAFVVGSMLTPVLVRRIRPAFVMAGGLRWRARSASRCSRTSTRPPASDSIAGGSTMFSLGMAPVFTLTTDLDRRRGAARARRRGVGHLRDQRRVRRRARHRASSAASASRSIAA